MGFKKKRKKDSEEARKKREEKIKNVLNNIIELFKIGNVPEAIKIGVFPPYKDVPSNNWSLSNRIIQQRYDSSDCRGFRQWQEVGRTVKKGASAVGILAPRMMKIKKDSKEESEDSQEVLETQESVKREAKPKPKYKLVGFTTINVFKVEDTEGEDLDYTPITLPDFPLMDKAKEWDISVKGITFIGHKLGSYSTYGGIQLATPHEKTFFHEMAHAAHERVLGKLQRGQIPSQEIVAELSAQVLALVVGRELESTLGNSYEYIKRYSQEMNRDVGSACLSVISDVEKVLTLLLDLDSIR